MPLACTALCCCSVINEHAAASAPDVGGLPKAVLLSLKQDQGSRDAALLQRLEHELSLVGGHHLVLQALRRGRKQSAGRKSEVKKVSE
jgi:hypothetical protein